MLSRKLQLRSYAVDQGFQPRGHKLDLTTHHREEVLENNPTYHLTSLRGYVLNVNMNQKYKTLHKTWDPALKEHNPSLLWDELLPRWLLLISKIKCSMASNYLLSVSYRKPSLQSKINIHTKMNRKERISIRPILHFPHLLWMPGQKDQWLGYTHTI